MEPHDKVVPNRKYYHHPTGGCNLVPAAKKSSNSYSNDSRYKNKDRMLYFQLCLTHGVDVCRCGWEFKKHPVNQPC